MNLNNPKYYINRELSWLDFNFRVLDEACNNDNPLFEKLKFIAITSSNLDEFFMVRVAGLKEQVNADYVKEGIAGYTAKEQLSLIKEKVVKFIKLQYNYLNNNIKKDLNNENIFLKKYKELDKLQERFVISYFKEFIYPTITPMAIDNSRPLPLILNKSINFLVKLRNNYSEDDLFCIIEIPMILDRCIKIPSIKGNTEYILLEEIIKGNLESFFEGHNINSYSIFRVTRNGDISVEETEAEDLLIEIEKSLQRRKWGFTVRLEVEKNTPIDLKEYLINSLEITEDEIYYIDNEIDLTYLFKFYEIKNTEKYKYEKQLSQASPYLYKKDNYFDILKERDIILHHPYQSFEHVIEFIEKASIDPNVLAIKQTLYRVSGDSPIVAALMKAAENGKQVTVLIELRARFDEERNIEWAKKLEKSGCHVVYGLSGLKIHAKAMLIVRKEDDEIKRYVHLSTGNYNDATAKVYTDISFFTSKNEYCKDISNLFNFLTGFFIPKNWEKIGVAPFNIRETIINLIDNEIEKSKNGKNARIIIKVNSVVDKDIIIKLYEAAINGVKIDMIVRGICCMRANIGKGSENINIISIIGRYLEHSRIYYFENSGNPQLFLSSADLMTRNLDRRVELFYPIEDSEIIDEIKNILEISLIDTKRSRKQLEDGQYSKVDWKNKKNLDSQNYFYARSKDKLQKNIELLDY